MKSILKFLLYFPCLFLFFSCSNERSDENPMQLESQADHAQNRNPNNDPFYDLLYTYDILNMESVRVGSYAFVNEVMAYLQNNADSESIYSLFKQNNIYPCWNCAEPEYYGFHNYYIPFYHLGDSRLVGILIAQEKNKTKSFYYLSKSVVTQINSIRPTPNSQYWDGIMTYFDLDNYPDGRDQIFASSKMPCLWFNGVCGCPDISPSGELTSSSCHMDDIINPDCDAGYCPSGSNSPGNDIEDIDFFEINDWISHDEDSGGSDINGGNNNEDNGGGTNADINDPNPNWNENCESYDGSLSAGIVLEEGGEIVIDESTGTIAIDELDDLYELQVTAFINDYNLPYTPKELMDLIGEKCAVMDVQEVRTCLKCHFISPLGLSSSESWKLADDFDIVASCATNPDPNCVKCTISLNKFLLHHELELSQAEINAINAGVPSYSCSSTNYSNLVKTVLINLIVNNLGTDELNWLINHFHEYLIIKEFINASDNLNLAKTHVNDVIGFLINNPDLDFTYVVSNKTELTSNISETWDNTGGPFAEHPIEDFDDTATPWPSYGPVILKKNAVVFKLPDYDCHKFSKMQIAKSGYQISNYFLTYVGENSPDNVIHFETIQVYTDSDGVNVGAVDDALDYLYSALKRNIPVVVGVDILSGFSFNPVTDGTTDHFVVIVGMGTDNKGNYFRFYDSADVEIDRVTNTENKFYFQNNIFEGYSNVKYSSGRLFRITQIRKSKPN